MSATPPPGSSEKPPPPPRLPSLAGDMAGVDRAARLQTMAAVALGLALIAIPLYLWRRPRSESIPVAGLADSASSSLDAGAAPPSSSSSPAAVSSATAAVLLSEAKVMECHDPGSHHTRAEDCDHLASIEKGFAAAITSAGACVPAAAGGGTLVYVLDASFGRKRHPFELFVPRDGRALKSGHASSSASGSSAAASACSAAVKHGLDALTLDGVAHAHSRYKIAITATYTAPGN